MDSNEDISQKLPNIVRTWMILSKSAFPHQFSVLFESYKTERDERNLTDTAMRLSDLIKKFPNEPNLVNELRSIVDALSSGNNEFLKEVFEMLPQDIKHKLMLAVTRNAHSIEDSCQLMVLFLKRMPNVMLRQHGNNIVETLLSAEDKPGIHIPVNLFRKMLVCDVLPLVLKVPECDYKIEIVFHLLQKAIEFYIPCMFMHFLKQSKHSAIKNDVIAFSENNAEEGWKSLFKLFEIVAIRYKWNCPEMFASNFSVLGLQQLLSLLKTKNELLIALTNKNPRGMEETSGFLEAYFGLLITFFYCLYNFGRLLHPQILLHDMTGPYNYVLMEGISFPPDDCPETLSSDFKQTDEGHLVVSKNGSQDATLLSASFLTAVECFDLIHHNIHLAKAFTSVYANTELEYLPLFQEFQVDLLVFEKSHRRLLDHTRTFPDKIKDVEIKNRVFLQRATSSYYMRDYEHSLEILFGIIVNLSPSVIYPVKSCISKCPERFAYFMAYNNSDILQYCICMLLKLYKSKDKIDDAYKDVALGYMLILMQYNLENEYQMFQRCIDDIKKAKEFCFPKFFKYVINVHILEHIEYLATTAGGNVNLKILPTSTYQAGKQHTVTGDVAKGAKDDLKQAFINQKARCYDNLDNLFIEFFKEEHTFLLLPLNM